MMEVESQHDAHLVHHLQDATRNDPRDDRDRKELPRYERVDCKFKP